MIEVIILIGVWGNLMLQSAWFFWSYKFPHRKHYTDDVEIDLIDKLDEYFETKLQNEKLKANWGEFHHEDIPKDLNPQRGENGKYNHEEVQGALDGLFGGQK